MVYKPLVKNFAKGDGMNQLAICRPDDWHLHLRDGKMLAAVIDDTSRHFGRAIIMPNLIPPVVDPLQEPIKPSNKSLITCFLKY